ncbi:MAG TPA: nuclear transport factor 2 family protein [Burkholderiales bacterium]|nr:nuclear transport factor 2 family protein [Burkholderiales bacterium]
MSDLKVTPEEYVEILNLYSAYNLASDAGDAEAYADCFMEKGEHHGTYDIYGRAALIEYKKADFAKRTHLYRRHWNGSIHLEKIDARTIRGRCYFFGYNGEPGKVPHTTHAGVYTDLIRQEHGRWKFAERRIAFDGVQ